MRFTIFPQGSGSRWVLRDGVEVIAKSAMFGDRRSAVEDARRFKRAIALSEFDCQEEPWKKDAIKTPC